MPFFYPQFEQLSATAGKPPSLWPALETSLGQTGAVAQVESSGEEKRPRVLEYQRVPGSVEIPCPPLCCARPALPAISPALRVCVIYRRWAIVEAEWKVFATSDTS